VLYKLQIFSLVFIVTRAFSVDVFCREMSLFVGLDTGANERLR